MNYMVYGYGSYDVDETDALDIKTVKEAEEILDEKVMRWCEEHGIDPVEANYDEGDHYFSFGREEHGVAIYAIYEIPDFKNEVEELIWKAKFEMDKAEYAADDYAWTLMDCGVEQYTSKAKELLDRAMELMNP